MYIVAMVTYLLLANSVATSEPSLLTVNFNIMFVFSSAVRTYKNFITD